jgi:hypothetical protein
LQALFFAIFGLGQDLEGFGGREGIGNVAEVD